MEKKLRYSIIVNGATIFVMLVLLIIHWSLKEPEVITETKVETKIVHDTVPKYIYVDEYDHPVEGSYWFVTIETMDHKVGYECYKLNSPTFDPAEVMEKIQIDLENKYPDKDYSYVLIKNAVPITETAYNNYLDSRYKR